MDYQIGMYCIEQKMTEVEVHGNVNYALEMKAFLRKPYIEAYKDMDQFMKDHKAREIQELTDWTMSVKQEKERLAEEQAAAAEANGSRRPKRSQR